MIFDRISADRNFDVYGYALRFDGIPSGTCEAGPSPYRLLEEIGIHRLLATPQRRHPRREGRGSRLPNEITG